MLTIESGNSLTAVVLCAWVPITWLLFALLGARKAVLASVVAGWLFLPIAEIHIEGLPEIRKFSTIVLATWSGVLLFDRRRCRELRPTWTDLPLLLFVATAGLSSLSNGHGWYDAASVSLNRAIVWLAPYSLGRVYFADPGGWRALAIGVVAGGVAYVPISVLEIFLGPTGHGWVYGYQPHDPLQELRSIGWRPPGFMTNGLMVALWMAWAALSAGWLWYTGAAARLFRVPSVVWMTLLSVMTILTQSVNAWFALGLGTLTLGLAKRGRALLLLAVMLLPAGYVSVRVATAWPGRPLIRAAVHTVGHRRARSLQFRLRQENRLMRHAWRQPWFGWGSWDNWRVRVRTGITVADSRWIIVFAQNGLLGLASLLVSQIAPLWAFARRFPVAQWGSAAVAPAAVLAAGILLNAVDQCFNDLITPMYVLALGGMGRRA